MALHKLVNELIRKAHLDRGLVKIRILLLASLLILLDFLLLELFDLFLDLLAKRILELFGLLDHLVDGQVRDAVALSEHLREVSLA